ncbi:MAG: ABC transporter ATP-binding protein [Chloroflexi bacterium]|nr:ABC transporter ATP-binding protein [Chloroflexota bacterium]
MLKVEGIHTYYGLSHILFGVSLEVARGQAVCLLGRNGAGKTTTLKSIVGLTPPRAGRVIFKDQVVNGRESYQLARLGIAYVPDDRRIFADLTVRENLDIAARGRGWDLARVYELFPQLKAMETRRGGYLSGGEQKMLAISRALMGNPDFLLLDEPMEGLAPVMVQTLEDRIKQLKQTGLTVLIAEQNIASALALSDRVYVIDDGHIRFHGTVEEFNRNEEIRKKYLQV